jgi:uracil-DNA glycosylase
MQKYYELVLKTKIEKSDKILLLWKCSIKYFWFEEFFLEKVIGWKKFFTLIHPSKRNILLYRNNKNKILEMLKKIFN